MTALGKFDGIQNKFREKIYFLAKSKLRIELTRETELEESIKEQLDSAQLELEKAIIKQAKLWFKIYHFKCERPYFENLRN